MVNDKIHIKKSFSIKCQPLDPYYIDLNLPRQKNLRNFSLARPINLKCYATIVCKEYTHL